MTVSASVSSILQRRSTLMNWPNCARNWKIRRPKESDWKIFRQLHKVALQRFCERVLAESELLHRDTTRSAHERYLAIYQFFRERDKELAQLFDDFRRSTAVWQIAAIKAHGLLTDEEFARFSQETQNLVAVILGDSLE
jgi:hypothetical protein